MAEGSRARAKLRQIIEDNPGVGEARLRALCVAAVIGDQEAEQEAVRDFIDSELRKQQQSPPGVAVSFK